MEEHLKSLEDEAPTGGPTRKHAADSNSPPHQAPARDRESSGQASQSCVRGRCHRKEEGPGFRRPKEAITEGVEAIEQSAQASRKTYHPI